MGASPISAPRTVARTVLVVFAVLISLYVIYLLRRPIGWLFVAVFLAVALTGPVTFLERRGLRRGYAIFIIYLGLMAVPVALGAVLVPPVVTEVSNLADEAPQYADDVSEFVQSNGRLRELDADYDLTGSLRDQAAKLPEKLGGAAGTLRDVGLSLVNSIFALVTILILTAFMLGGGRRWIDDGLRYMPEERAERIETVLRRSAAAVGNYVAGALVQATVAGILSFVVLTILGVPYPAPLALIVFFLDLIPLVGATIGAFAVGIATLFASLPTATIVWAVWSIAYQQVENNLIQPQIQRRAVSINPFLVIVSVLFGATLLGILGALVAVPVAASIQIAAREFMDYRGIEPRRPPAEDDPREDDPPPPLDEGGEPRPAPA